MRMRAENAVFYSQTKKTCIIFVCVVSSFLSFFSTLLCAFVVLFSFSFPIYSLGAIGALYIFFSFLRCCCCCRCSSSIRSFLIFFLLRCVCNSLSSAFFLSSYVWNWANCLSLHFTQCNHTLLLWCGVFRYWCSHYSVFRISRVAILPFFCISLSRSHHVFQHHFFLILRIANYAILFSLTLRFHLLLFHMYVHSFFGLIRTHTSSLFHSRTGRPTNWLAG